MNVLVYYVKTDFKMQSEWSKSEKMQALCKVEIVDTMKLLCKTVCGIAWLGYTKRKSHDRDQQCIHRPQSCIVSTNRPELMSR